MAAMSNMALLAMNGTRLSFVVRQLEGTVVREITPFVRDKKTGMSGIERKQVEQPAGYMVYFPRGHSLRLTEAQLKVYKLRGRPKLINLQGLDDPNSPLGRLMMAQDADERDLAFESLEKQVIALATAKSGKILMPEQIVDEVAAPGDELDEVA